MNFPRLLLTIWQGLFLYINSGVFFGVGVIEDTPGNAVVSTGTPILSRFG